MLISSASGLHAANSASLIPFSCCDGQIIVTNAGGQAVWQNISGSSFFNFKVPASLTFTSGAPVYVQAVYYDEGYGQISLQYDSVTNGAYAASLGHVRSSRVDTKGFATAYYVLSSPAFLKRQGTGADLRLGLSGGGPPLSVRSATIQNFPFPDAQFQAVLGQPWLQPYTGPSRDDVDRSTLQGKVMAGYQGWFRTPNDLSDQGWGHWVRNGAMHATNFNIDMWPDLAGYGESELFPATGITTRSGQPAKLFSSTIPETVHRHFQWMRKYNIDGAFLQRFVSPNSGGAYGGDEWVLNNVRAAAHQEGRIWAIEYDVSSLNDANALQVMTNDWRWLVDTMGLPGDSRYAHEGGKPVVFIWGLPFPDRGISKANANAIVDFFKNDPVYGGNYVIGGWPWWWRTMPDWNDHFQRYDGALAWMPQNAAGYLADYQQLNSWGIDYFPHVWPGFSWAHLQRLNNETQYSPRGQGLFYWQNIYGAIGSGASRLFIGMFDEYDEGTAIMPMTDDPPSPAPNWGRFLTNLGKPSDWWLLLTSAAREMLLGSRPLSASVPTEAELIASRSKIGPQAAVDLGVTNQTTLLYPVERSFGLTTAETFAGRDCRRNSTPGTDHYFYFNVEDTFAYQIATGMAMTVEVEYFDASNGVSLTLQYDAIGGAYTTAPQTIPMRASGLWRTARFQLAEAFMGNRENGGTDFRIVINGSGAVHIDRVRVSLPDDLPSPRQATVLQPAGSTWRYLDTNVAPAAWTSATFDDVSWKSGSAPLGYGVGDEATVTSYGGNANAKRITTWFRSAFVVTNPTDYCALVLGTRRNDGAVIYLNGQEIYRGNLPAGVISSGTLATNGTDWLDRQLYFEHNLDAALLVAGTNTIAAEVHLLSSSSPDMSFDFTLAGLSSGQVRPQLNLSLSGGGTTLVWPANMGFFIPFSATNLVAPVTWTRATNALSLSSGQWKVTVAATNPAAFFRLQPE
ncbi:MAG: hypothetical protein JWQ71_593 [Pedosphaera sp.]|nr:hypothetical protein [Pedosphaera sp.]